MTAPAIDRAHAPRTRVRRVAAVARQTDPAPAAPTPVDPPADPTGEIVRGLTRDQLIEVLRRLVWAESSLRHVVRGVVADTLTARWKAEQAAANQAMGAWFAAGAVARASGLPADHIAYYQAQEASKRADACADATYKRLMDHYDQGKPPA